MAGQWIDEIVMPEAMPPDLDLWVARAEGHVIRRRIDPSGAVDYLVEIHGALRMVPLYSSEPLLAQAIMARECIETFMLPAGNGIYRAAAIMRAEHHARLWAKSVTVIAADVGPVMGITVLVAAMRCFVFASLGDDWPGSAQVRQELAHKKAAPDNGSGT